MQQQKFSRFGFFKSYVLPALVIFLIPGLGWWFFDHVESHFDDNIRKTLLTQIQTEADLTAEQRAKMTEFYEKVSASKILASNKPEARQLQESFSSVSTRYAIFRWMKRIALLCLFTGIAALIATSIGVAYSFRSQPALYWSLRSGWIILRPFAVVQVLGQGALVVALSFWVTAFFFEHYYVKLIAVAGILALCAALLLIKAIFRKLPTEAEFVGRLLKREAAPSLWARVSEMAQKLGIAPPDNIFVGIDDNFFVTEHPIKVRDEHCIGRTLFVSLSLLKALSRSESEAVLAHELAHFSGDDTIYSRRISPLLGRYAHYLEALYQGGLSRPVFYFMLLFWNLFHLSLNKIRREREFRADSIGSELTSSADMAQALVKVSAYCRYRENVQKTLFEKDENVETMDVFQRVERGFPNYMAACIASRELKESDTPHPFDSHPPLVNRLQNLGLEPDTVLSAPASLPAAGETWFSDIDGAADIEAEEWKAFEEFFQRAHQESLAWRFKPEGEAEAQHVAKYFPPVQLTGSHDIRGTLDHDKLVLSGWDSPLFFSSIEGCRVDESFGKQQLIIDYRPAGEDGKQKRKVNLKNLFGTGGVPFLEVFKKYYARHLAATQYHKEKMEKLEGTTEATSN